MRRLSIAAIALTVAAIFVLLMGSQPAAAEETAPQEHDGHRGIWLRTEAVEAFVALEPKFRVLSIRRPGEASLLAGAEVAEQGLRLAFMEPDQVPASFDPGNASAVLMERSGSAARVRLGAAAGLQYRVRIELDTAEPGLTLTYDLLNAGNEPRRVACWSVIAFQREGTIVAPFGDKPRARRRVVLPWWSRWPQQGVRFGRDAMVMDMAEPLEGNACKVGLITDAGWIAFVRGSKGLVSRVKYEAGRTYPEDGANVTAFQCVGPERTWCEIEQVGPLMELAPGESLRMTERVRLLRIEQPAEPAPDALRSAVETAMRPAAPLPTD